jgi:hypothetical protein
MMDSGTPSTGNKTLLIVATALLFAAGVLHATEPPQPGEGQRACRSDVIAHCSDFILGQRHKIRACLKEHVAVISPGCRDFLARAEAFEMEQYCAEFRGQADEMRACIRRNWERLTPACQRFLQDANQGAVGSPHLYEGVIAASSRSMAKNR